MIIGQNGILNRAIEAKKNAEQSQKNDMKILSDMENIISNAVSFSNINLEDTNPSGAMPSSVTVLENNANKGIVIKDKNNNEWVWIEVPKTIVFQNLTIDITNELTEENYKDIQKSLEDYAKTYREGAFGQNKYWNDEWYNGCGLSLEKYTELYQKVLKSIYTYGGFWIRRYEVGIEGSTEDISKARFNHTNIFSKQ